MKKFFKGIAVISVLLIAASAFAACGNSSSSSKKEESSAAAADTSKEESKEESKKEAADSCVGTWKTDSFEWAEDTQGVTEYDVTAEFKEDGTYTITEKYAGAEEGVEHSVEQVLSGTYTTGEGVITIKGEHIKLTMDGQSREEDAPEGSAQSINLVWNGDTIVYTSTNAGNPVKSVTLKK